MVREDFLHGDFRANFQQFHLREFCNAHVDLFLKKSIAYNAGIAVREIAPHYLQFLRLKRDPITTEAEQRQLKATLESLWRKLEVGKSPLMLVYSHVMNLTSISSQLLSDGRAKITMNTTIAMTTPAFSPVKSYSTATVCRSQRTT